MRILIMGYVVRGPLGGVVWHHLQYMMGLHRLGHDVYFLEDSDDYESCYDPVLCQTTTDPSYGLGFASFHFERVGLGERWAYFDAHQNEWRGPAGSMALELLRSADLLLNISCINPLRDWSLQVPYRALIDTDPVFVQVRHLKDEGKLNRAREHTAFFTFGENFGQPGCTMPDDGLPWMPTRQPVVLDAWPVNPGNIDGRFTTVMQWESYPPVEYQGRWFGMKSGSFEPYMTLPMSTAQPLEVAMGSVSAPRACLRDAGWIVSDPVAITRTGWTYQEYIQQSKAEFSLAKHGYHVTRTGWFSDRSAVYLASGRPVVTQETGFTDWLKAEGGVHAFDSPESAVEAIDAVNQDYSRQCRLARAVAEEYFESGRVLNDLIARATSS